MSGDFTVVPDDAAEYTLPQFAIVLQDPATVGGDLEISGGFHPGTIIDDSPAHIVGQFIRDNMASIAEAAIAERALAKRLASPAPANDVKIYVPGA